MAIRSSPPPFTMCGIIGIVSTKDVSPQLYNGLTKLEYRGYDSVGVCVGHENSLVIKKGVGKVAEVNSEHNFSSVKGHIGIAHCRWATHGGVTTENAHPHTGHNGTISVVHNGIIENFEELKKELLTADHHFSSETDSEIIAHLIEQHYDGKNLAGAVTTAIARIKGSYGLVVMAKDDPDTLVAVRHESPLIVGVGQGEMYVASDVPALLDYTKQVIYLHDKEIAVLSADSYSVLNSEGKSIDKEVHTIEWTLEKAEKQGYDHFMLKEIFEQPTAITETIQGRLEDDKVNFDNGFTFSDEELKEIKRIVMIACGTSWHAALTGEFMLEELAKIPVEVEYASEFRYRNSIIEEGTLVIAISQSGETADTNAALKEAKKRGAKTLGICNVQGSSLTRIADATILTKAGPEIGVASTKAFTTQLAVLYLLTIHLAQLRDALNDKQIRSMIKGIRKIPVQIQSMLEEDQEITALAEEYYQKSNALYLGRGVNYPIALEGALKLKEVSYIHAEGYPAAEMKHGPIALIDKEMPVVIIAPQDVYTYSKILGNVEEVKARGGQVIAIATHGDESISKKADHTLYIPKTLYTLSSLLATIPLQLFSYHVAKLRGCNIDKPRNLAKSVTVE